MKTTLILAGAIALVLISMESPAFGSPASGASPPPNEAIASLMSDTLINDEGLVRQKRSLGKCRYDHDCGMGYICSHMWIESAWGYRCVGRSQGIDRNRHNGVWVEVDGCGRRCNYSNDCPNGQGCYYTNSGRRCC